MFLRICMTAIAIVCSNVFLGINAMQYGGRVYDIGDSQNPEKMAQDALLISKSILSANKGIIWPLRSPSKYMELEGEKVLLVGSGYSYLGVDAFKDKDNYPFYTIDLNEEMVSSDVTWPMSIPDYVEDILEIDKKQDINEAFLGKIDTIILERLPIHVTFRDDGKVFSNCLPLLKEGGRIVLGTPPATIQHGEADGVIPDPELSAPFTIDLKSCASDTRIALREIGEKEPECNMSLREQALQVMVEYIKNILETKGLSADVSVKKIDPGENSSLWIKKSSKPQFVFVIQKK